MTPTVEKHPHVEQASAEELAMLLQHRDPALRQVYLDMHALILDTLPGVRYSTDLVDAMTGYGARQYGYGGWGMAALAAPSKWVSLAFMRGADLPDPTGILEGAGKNVRHVKVRSPEQLAERRDALRALIQAAAMINKT